MISLSNCLIESFDVSVFKAALKDLPVSMQSNIVVSVEAILLTTSGKIDRKSMQKKINEYTHRGKKP